MSTWYAVCRKPDKWRANKSSGTPKKASTADEEYVKVKSLTNGKKSSKELTQELRDACLQLIHLLLELHQKWSISVSRSYGVRNPNWTQLKFWRSKRSGEVKQGLQTSAKHSRGSVMVCNYVPFSVLEIFSEMMQFWTQKSTIRYWS